MTTVIIGGGVAGMTAGLLLGDAGREVIVLEREADPGGKVRSLHLDGWQVELGPAGILDNAPDTRRLFTRLDLAHKVLVSDDNARHRFVMRRGRLEEVPESPPKLLRSRVLPLSAKLRLFLEPLARRAPAGADETVAEFARRRLGREIAEQLVEPMVTGIFAGDYMRLSIASAFPKIVELERAHHSLLRGAIAMARAARAEGRGPARLTTLQGGMGALSNALAHALGDRLRRRSPVQALARSGDHWMVRTEAGTLAASQVILALPPDDAAALLRPVDEEMADTYAAIPTPGVIAVVLGFRRGEVAHPLGGFGFLVPRREKVRLLGSIWMTSTFPAAAQAPDGHVMLRCLFGGANDPHAIDLSDEQLIAEARDGLLRAIGLEAAPRFSYVARWPRGIAQYVQGHAARVERIESRGRAIGLHSTGAALRGVGVNDVIRESTTLVERLLK
jgi:oxygen-dependent protoporphyrinogen oxidase